MRQRTRQEALQAILGIAPKVTIAKTDAGNALTITDAKSGTRTKIRIQTSLPTRTTFDTIR